MLGWTPVSRLRFSGIIDVRLLVEESLRNLQLTSFFFISLSLAVIVLVYSIILERQKQIETF